MAKTDNQKCVNRARYMVPHRDPKWEDDAKGANRGREGAPFVHAEAILLWAAAFGCARDAKYGQPGGAVSEMLDGIGAPPYTAPFRRTNAPDAEKAGDTIFMRGKKSMSMAAASSSATGGSGCAQVEGAARVCEAARAGRLAARETVAAIVTDESAGDTAVFRDLPGAGADAAEGRSPMGSTIGIGDRAEVSDADAASDAAEGASVGAPEGRRRGRWMRNPGRRRRAMPWRAML